MIEIICHGLMNALDTGLCLLDEYGTIVMVNDAWRELTDSLTGVLKQRSFVEFANREAHRLSIGDGVSTVLRITIDHDGHRAGDTMLMDATRVIKSNLRSIDVMGRFEGDEFAVIMPGSDYLAAYKIADRIRKAVEEQSVEDNDQTAIVSTLSVGMSQLHRESLDVDVVLSEANQALEHAKQAKRNRISIFEELTLRPVDDGC